MLSNHATDIVPRLSSFEKQSLVIINNKEGEGCLFFKQKKHVYTNDFK